MVNKYLKMTQGASDNDTENIETQKPQTRI
jgi:hypothetical protein